MGNKTRKRKSKMSQSIVKNKLTQSKYHHLNMKVKDMLKVRGINSEKIGFIDNPNEIKMSAVILKIAEPYIKLYWGNEIRVRGIISLAIAAWNMTFLPQEKQKEFQEQLIEEILPNDCDPEDVMTMLRVFENLQKRQTDLFPNIRTVIMGHDLRIDKENIHLEISSAPVP